MPGRLILRALAVSTFALGLLTVLSARISLLAGVFLAMWFVVELFRVIRQLPGLWDGLFFGLLLLTVCASTALYAGVCAIIPALGLTTRTCVSVTWIQTFQSHALVFGLSGIFLWCFLRFWGWRQRR